METTSVIFEIKSEAHRKTALEALRAAKIGWVVRIEPANRTNAQNAFYWALLQSISEQVMPGGKSHSRDTWHIYFKTLFLPGRMIELPNGELIEQEPSTTGLNKEQFSEYVERVTAWATDHSVTHVASDTTMLA
jgi:hypothetical protein